LVLVVVGGRCWSISCHYCHPRSERRRRGKEFDGVRDALDRIAVFFVDAGEERGAGGEVAGEAGPDCDVGGSRHVLFPGLFVHS
jgi:hypothetical protein